MEATATVNNKRPFPTRWVIGGIIILLLGVAGFAVSQRSGATASDVQTGDIVTVTTGNLSARATASGTVTAVSTTHLSVNSPGVIEIVLVEAGQTVAAGDALIQLDATDLTFQVEKAQQALQLAKLELEALRDGATAADIAAAEAAVASAQVTLENLLAGPTAQGVAEAEANVRAQQAGVASASASYNGTLDSVSAATIAAAEAELTNAQIAYDSAEDANEDNPTEATDNALQTAATNLAVAQANLDSFRAGPNQGSVSSAAANVSAAAASVNQAQANFDTLMAGATAQQIAAAEASLAQAEANLASLTEPATAQEIAIAQATVEQAQLTLQNTQDTLNKATIIAPFDGLITAVSSNVGEYATGNVLEIVSSQLQVLLSVDEIDVGSIQLGQVAQITLETWPNETIDAEVTAIAPSATANNDLVAYDVTLTLADSRLPILVGMTANAELITASRSDVLLVPNAAITADRAAATYTVNLVTGEADGQPFTTPTEVTIGLKDSQFTQITGGLSAGDEVLIGTLAPPIADFEGPGGD